MFKIMRKLFRRLMQTGTNCFKNTQICLMQHKMIDLVDVESCGFAQRADIFRGRRNCKFINFLPVHGERFIRTSAFVIGTVSGRIIGVEHIDIGCRMHPEERVFSAGRDDAGRGRVSKEDTGCAICPVYHTRRLLRAYDEDVLVISTREVSIRHFKRIDESCASAVNIEAGAHRTVIPWITQDRAGVINRL